MEKESLIDEEGDTAPSSCGISCCFAMTLAVLWLSLPQRKSCSASTVEILEMANCRGDGRHDSL